MKVLYAIQGTGNGHISRAREIIPELQKYCETDILISGYQADVELGFEVKYRYRGLSFIFGKKGGIDLWNTYIEANSKTLRKEINSLPVEEYDFVINDFEPVSAWACYNKKIPCVSLSHQAAVLNKNAPKPKVQDPFGKFVLNNYAPTNFQFGFHFSRYNSNIFTPVIRKDIRNAEITDLGHYTVYLPAYSDKKLVKVLSQVKGAKWQVFSKHCTSKEEYDNISISPITNDHYIKSLISGKGLLCGAGFEAPAEALYLGKKLMVIPMKSQYEQQCNAASLKSMDVPVLKKLKTKKLHKIQDWVDSGTCIRISYPNNNEQIVRQIFETHILHLINKNKWDTNFSLKYKGDSENKAKVKAKEKHTELL